MTTSLTSHPHDLGAYQVRGEYVVDARELAPDMFVDHGGVDWPRLTWKEVGRPYTVERWAEGKRLWEEENGEAMPVREGWRHFNRSFHRLFTTDVPHERRRARRELLQSLGRFDVPGSGAALRELLELAVWNRVHRVEDAIGDPRGKRALFGGLDLVRPDILFLGAAEGYEAMQLAAMYPGGRAVLVDYDEFCKTERFGNFPEEYPFVGMDPASDHQRVWYRDQMAIDYVVEDIRDLPFGREFDIVVSIGLVEHFPDAYKPEAFELHRRFLKPGGYAILTTPRNQIKSRAFYTVMANHMNYGYRELMNIRQLGLYAWENGLAILRAGVIKAHNGLICRAR